jgi:23S rRNA pseudouridine2605 synthase
LERKQTLDRLLSKLGIASRVDSVALITSGRVKVNGRVVKEPGRWVHWPSDQVWLDGKALVPAERRFFLFHKPAGYVTSHRDERGRKTVFDLLPPEFGFLHAVGRLDKATSGLLLLTNDSQLSNFLTDPSNKVVRRYAVSVWGDFSADSLASAQRGVVDEGENLRCDRGKILGCTKRETLLELELSQGKNREIRRLCKALGHEVTKLHRFQYGPFLLEGLLPGEFLEIPLEAAVKACGRIPE